MPKKFLVVCLNPVIQKTLVFDTLKIDHVNRASKVRTDASGKGVNVARVLTQCGESAIHLTHAGGPNREWFLALCAADRLSVEWVDSGSEVRFCSTVIDLGAGTTTELVEEAVRVAPETEARLLERFETLIGSADVLIVSGTKAAGYSDAIVPRMAELAQRHGVLTILDVKGKDLAASLPFRPAVVKPNLSEFLATFPLPRTEASAASLTSASSSVSAARPTGAAAKAESPEKQKSPDEVDVMRNHVQGYALEWKKKYGTELVVTRGGAPIWFSERGAAAAEPVVPVRAINPTGSGDSFTAGLARVLSVGGGLREAIREGARLGALNAANLKPGSIESD
jgi:fructose-1-phosphate kinase PfkB-like protein